MGQQLVCPHCGTSFLVEESVYNVLLDQVRGQEFDRMIEKERKRLASEKEAERRLLSVNYEQKIQELQGRLHQTDLEKDTAVMRAISKKDTEIADLRQQISGMKMEKVLALKEAENQYRTSLAEREEDYRKTLSAKEEELLYYKEFKARQSTKMIGESLEQFCQGEFNRYRMMAFPNAYFEKDNDARTGSKGDFIYRESVDGIELLSIMFEMKNENDTTATKHKNEDFFKELDKDRRQKNCEYAILVSMLEADSDFYNTGIVDVSYRYPKMYVIRPQFFITIIGMLRNMALNVVETRRELVRVRERNVDIARLEDVLVSFKANVAKNYDLASRQFQTAIDEIDKSIDHLQKVKKSLLSSERNLRLLNDKTDALKLPSVRNLE